MQAECPVITDDIREVFENVLECLVGVDYQPIALLGSQTVAGTNYAIICEATVVYPDAVPYYAIVYITEGLDGTAALLDIAAL